MSDISIKEIYKLIDEMRRDINASIRRLEDKFDTMAAGRLTRLEKDFVTFVAQLEPIRKIVYGLVGTVMLAVIGSILVLVLK